MNENLANSFSFPLCCNWKDILTLVELLFTIAVSKAKIEHKFSKIRLTKTSFRVFLTVDRMESLLRILEQGSKLENYGIANAE